MWGDVEGRTGRGQQAGGSTFSRQDTDVKMRREAEHSVGWYG